MRERAVGPALTARRGEIFSGFGNELTDKLTLCRSELRPGDYVTISASRFPFPSVLPLDRRSEDWVDSISRTLNWNNRARQKAFDDAKKEEKEGAAKSG